MESIDDTAELGTGRSCGQFVAWASGFVNFWSEAKRGSRRITSKRLKSVRHNEKAKNLAQHVWDKMTPEHCEVIVEIDRIMTANGEIGIAQLKETLGQILDSVDVTVDELRAVHSAPVEALTYLLNQMIAIYNRKDASRKYASFVPVSKRIEELLVKAKEMGLGNIEVPKNKYVSEREKLAMIEKQIAGKLKLSGLKSNQIDKRKLETLKIEEIKKRRNKLAVHREKLKKQYVRGNRSKVIVNYNVIKKLEGDGSETTISSCVTQESLSQRSNFSRQDATNETASIDTSSWVISPTHKYYFGSSPPSIPKAFVTHEVYPKPIEMSDDIDKRTKIVEETHLGAALPVEKSDNWEIRPKMSFTMSELSLEPSTVGGELCMKYESHRPGVRSLDDLAESHGDASTIFDWTEPEKSQSFCCLSLENVAEHDAEDTNGTEAAGDGIDLARIKGEISMDTLWNVPQGSSEESSIPFDIKESFIVSTDESDERTSPNQGEYYDTRKNCDSYEKDKARDECSDTLRNDSSLEEDHVSTIYQPSHVEVDETESQISCIQLTASPEQSCGSTSEKESNEEELSIEEEQENNELNKMVNQAQPKILETKTKLMMRELQEEILKRYKLNREANEEEGDSNSTSDDENMSRSDVDLSMVEITCVEGPSNVNSSNKSNSNIIQVTEHTAEPLLAEPGKESGTQEMKSFVRRDNTSFKRTIRQTSPKKSVDNFKSADDISRPSQALNSGDLNTAEGESNVSSLNDCSTNNDDEESFELRDDQRARRPVKRNDMVTLTIVAIALGLGTLGYMTSVGGGNSHLFADLMAPTGGKVVNLIERALEVLRALPNRE